jgi:hypothetical protein
MIPSLLCIILFPSLAWSQSDFRRGYVIKTEGDTLFGLIDYRESAKANEVCTFKLSDQNETTYSPNTIAGYGFIDGNFFESRKLIAKGTSEDKIFIEVLIRGQVSLYKYQKTFWVQKADVFKPLLNEKKQIFFEGRNVLKETNEHIATLNIMLHDCASIRKSIDKVELREKSLTTLIERYNLCTGATMIVYKTKKPWVKPSIGLAAGVTTTDMQLSSFTPQYSTLTGSFGRSTSSMFGVSFDLLFPRLSERISFAGNLLYLPAKKFYRYTMLEYGIVERNYIEVEMQRLEIPVAIRYTFPERTFTPYLNLGVCSTVQLGRSVIWTREVESTNVVRTYNNEITNVKNYQVGIWGGAGIVKSISDKLAATLELRYEPAGGILPASEDESSLTLRSTNFQIVIGIKTK